MNNQESRNEFKELYIILRDYYREITPIERVFYISSVLYVAIYVMLFLTFLVATGKIAYNYLTIPLVFFPIISVIVTFNQKTILHGFAFFLVQFFPTCMGIFIFYTDKNSCLELKSSPSYSCLFQKRDSPQVIAAVVLLTFLILFKIYYCSFLFYFWKKGVWPVLREYEYSKCKEVNRMYLVYRLQFPIFHAKLMVMGLYIVFYGSLVWGEIVTQKIISKKLYNYLIPFDVFLLFYSFFLLKGVRDENKFLMFIGHIGNLFQAVLLYLTTSDFCYSDTANKLGSWNFCFKFNTFFDVFFVYMIISWVILILSTWNSIRCQMNFGLNMSRYIKFEPVTPEEERLYDVLPTNGFTHNHRDSRLATNRDSRLTMNRDLIFTTNEFQNLEVEIQNLRMEVQDLKNNIYLRLNTNTNV